MYGRSFTVQLYWGLSEPYEELQGLLETQGVLSGTQGVLSGALLKTEGV